MWQMIGVLAELERSLIIERTRAGVKAAKRRGVKFGRTRKLTAQQIGHARKLIDGGEHRTEVAALLNVDRTTLYRAMRLKCLGLRSAECFSPMLGRTRARWGTSSQGRI
jgi:DNA invertase Pin-like site-specific DNA recombinase